MDAEDDLKALLQAGAGFARHMLLEHGQFFPFANVVTEGGELQAVNVYEGEEHPTAAAVREALLQRLAEGARSGDYRAASVFTDVKVQPPGSEDKVDAVCAELEHRQGATMSVFLPYRKTDQGVDYGEMFAGKRDPSIFPGGDPAG